MDSVSHGVISAVSTTTLTNIRNWFQKVDHTRRRLARAVLMRVLRALARHHAPLLLAGEHATRQTLASAAVGVSLVIVGFL